ncbi:MAG TPA: penicillin-binding protein 2 [Spirochaetes bacterium]|nr:penicillin-binding protein 2 [Spirochaetota bacterium]
MEHASLRTRMLEAFRYRMYFFLGIVSFVFAVLIIQLLNLQLLQGESYRQRSRMNMESYIPIPASRGEMYDRNFKPGSQNVVIVSNRPSFNITMVPASYRDSVEMAKVLKPLCRLLQVPFDGVMTEVKSKNPWERIVIKEDVGFDTIVVIASNQNRFRNIDWEDAPVRVYNYGNMFSHTVGYIGSISPEEYKRLKQAGYRHYQKIGKSGLEKEYDSLLRGVDGHYRRIVDVRNRIEGEEIGLRPIAGSNLVLSLDFDVQKAAFDAMKDLRGAVIALKPSTGEVLALVSKPDFDSNLIISKNNAAIIEELYADKHRPFLNRAIQAKYPPASTFKLVTAISALEEDRWSPNRTYYCPGKYTLKGYVDRDFYCYDVHGSLDMYWAIARSCSVYFYQLGYKIGPTIMLKYADYLGLSEKTGIDIPGETAGFLPSKKWKLKAYGQQWYDGDTVNMAIGQGFISVTLVEMANLVGAIVNNGVIMRPHVVKRILSLDNKKTVKAFGGEKLKEIPLSNMTLSTVKQGMRMSVTSGTSARLAYLKVPIAGKTGTAQTRSRRKEDFSQHAWFVGYAPFDAPAEEAVVIAVLVEYGIAGAVGAVPVAEKIFAKLLALGYFNAAQR